MGIDRILEVLRLEGPAGIIRRVLMRLRWPGAIRSRYGPRFAANHSDLTFRFYVHGSYGDYYWSRLKGFDQPFVFLDIGANQGLYTIGAGMNTNCMLAVAFEPVPDTFSLLKENIKINNVSGKTRAVNAAISDHSGEAEIRLKLGHSGGATLATAKALEQRPNHKGIRVQLVSADRLAEWVPDDTCMIAVKIDVEGFEPVVVEELLRARFVDRISEFFIEIDEDRFDADVLTQRLRAIGFSDQHKIGSGKHYDLLATRPEAPSADHRDDHHAAENFDK